MENAKTAQVFQDEEAFQQLIDNLLAISSKLSIEISKLRQAATQVDSYDKLYEPKLPEKKVVPFSLDAEDFLQKVSQFIRVYGGSCQEVRKFFKNKTVSTKHQAVYACGKIAGNYGIVHAAFQKLNPENYPVFHRNVGSMKDASDLMEWVSDLFLQSEHTGMAIDHECVS